MLEKWKQQRLRRRAQVEARHLAREARRIIKKKRYRIPDAVVSDVEAAVNEVGRRQWGEGTTVRVVHAVGKFVPLLLRSRIPLYALRLLQSPAKARARTLREVERATRIDVRPDMTAIERLDAFEDLLQRALPFIFPAVKVHREYFGDGSMRQIAPVSPALHLGADRVLIVGTGRQTQEATRARSNVYPSLAQIAGHALNSIFLDSLMVDIERLERINRTLKLIPPEAMKESQLRPVKVLFITPSQPLERIAARFVHELPPTVRFILRPTGALNRSGSNLASYLLFEEAFCRALIELGYDDTMRRDAEVRQFFDYSEGRVHA